MKAKTNIKLQLNDTEKLSLRLKKIRISELQNFNIESIRVLLDASFERAREISALIEFQSIPSIGIKFAEDLIYLKYYSIDEFVGKNPATLTDQFELAKGYWIDPCVEDQFRLIVYYANTKDESKNWWNFTKERKEFRSKFGYPATRPQKAWFEELKR